MKSRHFKTLLLFVLFALFSEVRADFTSADSTALSSVLTNTETIRDNSTVTKNRIGDFYTSWQSVFVGSNALFPVLCTHLQDVWQSFTQPNGYMRTVIETIKNDTSTIKGEVQLIGGDVNSIKSDAYLIRRDVADIKNINTNISLNIAALRPVVTSIDTNVHAIAVNSRTITTNVQEIATRMENVESHVDTIRDTVDSIDTTLTNIGDTPFTAGYEDFDFYFTRPSTLIYHGQIHASNIFPDPIASIDIYADWFQRMEQWAFLNAVYHENNSVIRSAQLLRQSNIEYSLYDTTNLLSAIYEKIPTNLVSSVSSTNSLDTYDTTGAFSTSPYTLSDLTPSVSKPLVGAVHQSPALTGDFRRDLMGILSVMNLSEANNVAASLSILTNVQMFTSTISRGEEEVARQSAAVRQQAAQIAQDGQSHEHDLDDLEGDFALIDQNDGVKGVLRQAGGDVKNALNQFADRRVPEVYSQEVPTINFFDSGWNGTPLQIDVAVGEHTGVFRSIRNVFAVAWFFLGLFLVARLLLLGIRLLGWIANIVNGDAFMQGVLSKG